jgi:C1A family cysteine protease/PKD repeat protein
MGSSGFATGSSENSEVIQNNTSSAEPVIRNACINPNFLDSWRSDSIEPVITDDNGRVLGSGYKPSPVDLSGLSRSEKKLLVRAPGPDLPAVYDLRKEGKTTVAGNQGQSGCCWAFSSLASLESYLLGTEGVSYDFSENNMKNLASESYPEGFDLTPDEGGNAFISAAYLSRWTGPVNELEDPYNDLSIYSPTELPVQKHIQEILFLPVRTGSLDNEFIKRALQKYGAVYSTMYWDLAYYQEEYHTYQCTRSLPANHAITIVGWNDSFDRNKFTHVPPGDGAFIVKNSWGGAWGEEGYFYISYYDIKLGYNENAVFTAERKDNYDYTYQYDPLGWIISKEFPGSLIAWGGNVFSSERNETLRAVGFYTTDLNTAYEIYIYKNPVSGPINSRRVFVAKESGTYSLPGYHTHTLNSTVHLNPGEKFSVVIRFRNPSAGGPLAVEQPISFYSSKAQANPGESYVSQDGARWDDISEASEANLCIKAFTTTNELPEANFSSNVTGGNYPLTVQFNDLSKNSFSWEWDLNGDGIVDSTARNPIHTYDSYGIYTVSLKVSNRNGFDSETKNNYVTAASFSIDSANPEGSITTYQGDIQEFNISINRTCDISWYLNGEFKGSQSSVQSSSYSDAILSPGFYNITALAESGGEKLMNSWNWTVRDWNSWDNSTSREGENISTVELQQAIHIYHNGLKVPGTGAELTSERLKELIRLWRENPFD